MIADQIDTLVSWLLTYAIHSTVLIGGAWLGLRARRVPSHLMRDTFWKCALAGGLVTSTLQLVLGLSPGSFTLADATDAFSVPAAPVADPAAPGGGSGLPRDVIDMRAAADLRPPRVLRAAGTCGSAGRETGTEATDHPAPIDACTEATGHPAPIDACTEATDHPAPIDACTEATDHPAPIDACTEATGHPAPIDACTEAGTPATSGDGPGEDRRRSATLTDIVVGPQRPADGTALPPSLGGGADRDETSVWLTAAQRDDVQSLPAVVGRAAPEEGARDPAAAVGAVRDGASGPKQAPLLAREREAGSTIAVGADTASAPIPWATLIVTLWFVGAAWGVGRLLLARVRLERHLAPRRPVTDRSVLAVVERLRRAAGMRRPVRVTCSEGLSLPAALGRHEICLPPRAIEGLPASERECMLAHELAHLLRRDPTWLIAGQVIERIFFFQPLNRVARRRVQDAAEFLCDEWAVRHTQGHLSMARCLAEVARWIVAPQGRLAPVVGMAESRSGLLRRIDHLADQRAGGAVPRRPWWRGPAVGVALALTTLLAPGVSTQDAHQEQLEARQRADQARAAAMLREAEEAARKQMAEAQRMLDQAMAQRQAAEQAISELERRRGAGAGRDTQRLSDWQRRMEAEGEPFARLLRLQEAEATAAQETALMLEQRERERERARSLSRERFEAMRDDMLAGQHDDLLTGEHDDLLSAELANERSRGEALHAWLTEMIGQHDPGNVSHQRVRDEANRMEAERRAIEARMARMRAEREQMHARHREYGALRRELDHEREAAMVRLEASENDIAMSELGLRSAEGALSRVRDVFDRVDDDEERRQLEHEIERAVTEVERAQVGVDASRSARRALEVELSRAESRFGNLMDDADHTEQRAEDLEHELEDLAEHVEHLDERRWEIEELEEERLHEQQEQRERFLEELMEREDERMQRQAELLEREAELRERELERAAELRERELERAADFRERELERLDDLQGQRREQFNDQSGELDDLRDVIEQTHLMLREMQERMRRLEERLDAAGPGDRSHGAGESAGADETALMRHAVEDPAAGAR